MNVWSSISNVLLIRLRRKEDKDITVVFERILFRKGNKSTGTLIIIIIIINCLC